MSGFSEIPIALDSLRRAIQDLTRPRAEETVFSPLGAERRTRDATNNDAAMRLLVTEDLIGAAFVVGQTYINAVKKGRNWPPGIAAIDNVANYWKHRDEWTPQDWASAKTAQTPKGKLATIAGVAGLGVSSDAPGQLTIAAIAALNSGFDVDRLWEILATWR